MSKIRLICFLLSTAVLPASAFAADLAPAPVEPIAPIVPVFSWTGFYVGANAGYAFGNDDKVGIWSGGRYYGDIGKTDADGFFGGGQVGYNYQFDSFVIGLEADFQGGSIKGDASTGNFRNSGFAVNAHSKVDWFGTVRPRVGYAFDHTLIYATGGLAYGQIKYDLAASDGEVGVGYSNSKTRVGWTAGGGIEQAITDNWTVKAEYLYTYFGDYNLNKSGLIGTKPSMGFSMVRLGVNYKF